MSIAQQVRARFQRLPEGGVIASRELHRLSAERQQADKAASRLYKTEGLQKLRNGIFFRPYNSRYFGPLPPREADVIRAVKRQYRAKVSPTGALAAYELGLTHSLPDAIAYETDKRISPIQLENHTLYFHKVDGKKMSSVEGSLLCVLKALEFLYEKQGALAPLQQKRARRLLDRYTNEQTLRAAAHWPKWFQERLVSEVRVTSRPYITGLSALNIPFQGRQADWHQMGMLYSDKFQIAGSNYESAPGLSDEELFDCSQFLDKHDVEIGTKLCATPGRAIKDILYTSIFKKSQCPKFFMLDQFMIDIPNKEIQAHVAELDQIANPEQRQLLEDWARDNELN